jgi:predicted DNA-binding transcriptional regulator AlpA
MTFSPEIEELLSKPTIRVSELRKIFGLSRAASYNAIKSGEFDVIRIGGQILVLTIPLRKKLGLPEKINDAINC